MKKVIKSISIDLEKWKIAEEIAKKDNRSISNLLEILIEKEKKKEEKNEIQRNLRK